MKQLDPKAVWLFFITYVFRWFLIIAAMSIPVVSVWKSLSLTGLTASIDITAESYTLSALNALWFIMPIFIIVCFIVAKLNYHFFRYELTEMGFRKESGIIVKKYVTIPYDRIQNVDIHRGLLSRMLGLSDLQIQTAGFSAIVSRHGMSGIGAEGRLPALSHEVAEALRDELIRRTRAPKPQGL